MKASVAVEPEAAEADRVRRQLGTSARRGPCAGNGPHPTPVRPLDFDTGVLQGRGPIRKEREVQNKRRAKARLGERH